MPINPYGTGIGGLLKKGWHLIPGVMGATVMGILGFGIGIFAVATRFPVTHPPKYKMDYIVYRPDDPRVNVPVRDLLD